MGFYSTSFGCSLRWVWSDHDRRFHLYGGGETLCGACLEGVAIARKVERPVFSLRCLMCCLAVVDRVSVRFKDPFGE